MKVCGTDDEDDDDDDDEHDDVDDDDEEEEEEDDAEVYCCCLTMIRDQERSKKLELMLESQHHSDHSIFDSVIPESEIGIWLGWNLHDEIACYVQEQLRHYQ